MKNIKKNFAYQMVYRILTLITPLVTAPLLSRALGAEKLGVYSASQAFVSYFMLFALLGVEAYGNRTIAATGEDRAKRQTFFWNIYAVQFAAGIISITAYVISIFCMDSSRQLIGTFQGIWLISCLLDINWFFFGCEEFRLTVTRNIIVKVLTVAGIAIFVRTPDDLYLYTILMAGSMAVSQMLLWISLRRFVSFSKPQWIEIKKHIKPMLFLFIPVLAMSVFHIMDKTMLDALSNEENVGWYYSADKVISIPLGVVCAVSTVMLPRIANVINNGTKETVKLLLQKSTELVIFLTCAVGFGVGAIAPEFVPAFFGPGYEPCVALVQIFIIVLFVKAISDLIRTQYLIPAGKDRTYTLAVICGAAVNLVSNYFLIRAYQARGAVYGTLIAELAVLLVQIWATRNEIPFIGYCAKQWFYLIYGILMFVAVRLVAGAVHTGAIWKLLLMILAGGVVYMGLCILTWRFLPNSIFFRWQDTLKQKIVHGHTDKQNH